MSSDLEGFQKFLVLHYACIEGTTWVRDLGDDVTPQQIWESCRKGTWMLWFMYEADIEFPVEQGRKMLHEVVTETIRFVWKGETSEPQKQVVDFIGSATDERLDWGDIARAVKVLSFDGDGMEATKDQFLSDVADCLYGGRRHEDQLTDQLMGAVDNLVGDLPPDTDANSDFPTASSYEEFLANIVRKHFPQCPDYIWDFIRDDTPKA